MKKTINIFLIPCILLFCSEIFIGFIFNILNTVSFETQTIELLNIKIIIFALMIFTNNLIKAYKSEK
ncbi:MAG: hypothetical protein ACRC41_01395 [Sarcina sp.]